MDNLEPVEHQDHQACAAIMEMIEMAARKSADFGSEFAGRNWLQDKDEDAKVADVCKSTVAKLRDAYREMSAAEAIVESRSLAAVPIKKPGVFRRLFLPI